MKHSQSPQLFSWQCSKKHYEENMDKLFEDKGLVERFGGFKNVKKYRAFAQDFREMFVWIDHSFFGLKQFKKY